MTLMIVGVDVSKEQLDIAFCAIQGEPVSLGAFPNESSAFEKVAQAIKRLAGEYGCQEIHLVVEPTGGYEYPFACFAYRQAWRVSLPNPWQVRRWAQGIGQRGKTDRQDAQLLARYGRDQKLPRWQPLPESVTLLQDLLDRRQDIEKMLRQERDRQHALQAQGRYRGLVQKSVESTLLRLEVSLAEIEQGINAHLGQHPDLQGQSQVLKEIPGVGDKGSVLLLALLHRWDCLTQGQGTAKGLTAYVGLDPQPHESGSGVHRRSRVSRQGNDFIRSQLFWCALGGIRSRNSPLRSFYERLVAAGKPKMVALVAAARKILVWSWVVFHSGVPFDPALACARAA